MLLNINELTKEYRRGERAFKAVDSASLSLEKGDFACIMGKSGSGKTTLLNMIAGLTTPTGGSIFVEDNDISKFSDEEASKYRNSRIGYIPQGQNILPNLTVLDNVRLPKYFFNSDSEDPCAKAMALLEKVGIADLADSYPKHLSGGELKRVAIARAFMNNPKLLIADEPTGDLDKQTTKDIMLMLQAAAKNNMAVLMVTHEPDTIQYANMTYEMNSGVLTKCRKA